MPIFAKNIGIDLGTANTLVYVKGEGIVLNEPSVVAFNESTGKVIAIGSEAKDMIGRSSQGIEVVKPLKEGVIADFSLTEAMLRYFIKKVYRKRYLVGPKIVICVPSEITDVEKRAVEEVVLNAGAKQVFVIEEPMAAAIGAGLPVDEASGSMIVDIGGGTTEIAVISLGGLVTNRSIPIAGNAFDMAIVNYVRKEFSVLIGEVTAEWVKIQVGSAMPYEEEHPIAVKGRDLLTGFPKNINLSPEHVREAMQEGISGIVDGIKQVLEKTPPELSADVIENGIALAGGGAQIKQLAQLITIETGIKSYIADNPFECDVLGTGKYLGEIGKLQKLAVSAKRRMDRN